MSSYWPMCLRNKNYLKLEKYIWSNKSKADFKKKPENKNWLKLVGTSKEE